MSKEKKNPVLIRESLHTRLKIRAAAEGRKLGRMVEEKLEELVPEIPKAPHLHPQQS